MLDLLQGPRKILVNLRSLFPFSRNTNAISCLVHGESCHTRGAYRQRSSIWVFLMCGLLPTLCLLPLRSCGTESYSNKLHPGCLAFSDRLGEASGFACFLFVGWFVFSLEPYLPPSPSKPFLFLSSSLWELFTHFPYTYQDGNF